MLSRPLRSSTQKSQRGIAATKLHYNRQILSLTEFAETTEKYPFCRSRECPTGKNQLPEFSEMDVFALAVLSARAKILHSLSAL